MKYYGKAEEAANKILDAFKTGTIPDALNMIFINRDDDRPCLKWSWSNQLLAAIYGNGDARGFRQWEEVGRHVKKGEHAFPILAPCIRKEEVNGKEESHCYGFKSVAVFGYSQTDGDELPYRAKDKQYLDALPCVEVARKWGLSVECFNGAETGYKGYYKHNRAIAVGVESIHVWAHELIHAADHKAGNLTEKGQNYKSETVADFGAVVLLEMLGFEKDSDRGFCWKYISAYCEKEDKQPVQVCMSVLKRVCEAINLILTEYQTASRSIGEWTRSNPRLNPSAGHNAGGKESMNRYVNPGPDDRDMPQEQPVPSAIWVAIKKAEGA